jgi:hypothetical protein
VAQFVVYAGEPESYVTFIGPKACIALNKYLDFRREHGEQISESSPLFREKFDPVEALSDEEQRNNNNIIIISISNSTDSHHP